MTILLCFPNSSMHKHLDMFNVLFQVSKIAKVANVTKKWENSIWVSKTPNFMLISNSLTRVQNNAPKKFYKYIFKFWSFLFYHHFLDFLPITFLWTFIKTHIIWNQNKILQFLFQIAFLIFFIILHSIFSFIFLQTLNSKRARNEAVSRILKEVKTYFLPISIVPCLIPTENPKRCQIESPTVGSHWRILN